jgi:DNA invertase Pin-like site-specific DNA recombinase
VGHLNGFERCCCRHEEGEMTRTRVALYGRVPSLEFLLAVLGEVQLDACRAYACEQGWEIAGVWREDWTGTATYEAMLAAADDWDAVLMYRYDRIDGRDADHQRERERLTAMGKELWSLEALKVAKALESAAKETVADVLQGATELGRQMTMAEAERTLAQRTPESVARRTVLWTEVEVYEAFVEKLLEVVC